MTGLLDLSIAELGKGYRDGSVSPVAVTEAALERIEATNDTLHSFNILTSSLISAILSSFILFSCSSRYNFAPWLPWPRPSATT